jgi:hypothetical protein
VRALRTLLVAAVLLAVAAVGLDALADATQTRPDPRRPGEQTVVVVDVRTNRYRQDLLTAATTLWGSCAATVRSRLTTPTPTELAPGRFQLVLEPALGAHGRERLLGCLRDHTVDRVRGSVVSVADRAA